MLKRKRLLPPTITKIHLNDKRIARHEVDMYLLHGRQFSLWL